MNVAKEKGAEKGGKEGEVAAVLRVETEEIETVVIVGAAPRVETGLEETEIVETIKIGIGIGQLGGIGIGIGMT